MDYTFILDVLKLFSLDETDGYDRLFWRCNHPGEVWFYVNVNDVFWWATADIELITVGDVAAIRQALADVAAIDAKEKDAGFDLWAARKRHMRPQQAAYPKNKRLWALFDACGPVRTEEG